MIPSSQVVGTEYDAPFSYTLPAFYYDVPPKPAHIALAAFVVNKVDHKTGKIFNCESVPIVSKASAGKTPAGWSFTNGRRSVKVPAGAQTLSFFGINGRLVKSISVSMKSGLRSFDLSGIGSGVFVAKIGSGAFSFAVWK